MVIIKWYHYLAAFFAGFFLANAVPHFVHGVSGDPFPSPFWIVTSGIILSIAFVDKVKI